MAKIKEGRHSGALPLKSFDLHQGTQISPNSVRNTKRSAVDVEPSPFRSVGQSLAVVNTQDPSSCVAPVVKLSALGYVQPAQSKVHWLSSPRIAFALKLHASGLLQPNAELFAAPGVPLSTHEACQFPPKSLPLPTGVVKYTSRISGMYSNVAQPPLGLLM